ncbi:MAG: methionine--tRNA ligase [Alphaproteobacteria bacterium]|nr:MAG: methionine--tRNA ligase [Alphaproteobacteria bacterium]
MTDNKKSYYITTPIYYVNDKPHLGHAYTTVACDVLARFKRLDGYDVKFLTGTDEHGLKIYQTAEKQGITPQELTDRVSVNFREMGDLMNISNDQFIRTTDAAHKKAAQAIWQKMQDAGDIYLDKYAGWYSVRDEAFYSEDEITDGENGEKLSPFGSPCEWTEEESYFFKLSAWETRLLEFYDAHPDFILPQSRRNEVVSFVKGGLRDLSISRTTFDWGVKVPGDEKHVMYVWVDALTNYISALGYPDTSAADFKKFWPADLHMVGKDILRFHAVYWPAFLMSAGIELPKRIFAHGWWTAEGKKMSKSIGNVIAPAEAVEKYGLDQLRYFILREVPFGNDGDFSHDAMVGRMNSDLANNLGNLAQRSLSMIAKNCDGKVPVAGDFTVEDSALLKSCGTELLESLRKELDGQMFHKALETVWRVLNDANAYIDAQAPWTLKKTDPARMATVLYVVAETVRNIGILLQPVMPESTEKLLDLLALTESERSFAFIGTDHALKTGAELPTPQGVFPRYVEGTEAA